jgi:deoxyribonuclease V
MNLVHPEYVPDPALSREEMEALQRELAADARFEDDFDFDPARVYAGDGTDADQTRLDGAADEDGGGDDHDAPVVVGVDQAFLDEVAVSAVVAMQGGTVVERAWAVADLEIPYIPGLLSFREGEAIIAALDALSVEPDLAVVDGSGRIHFRQAGIATHVGVMFDRPAIGVAKKLLCGTPRGSLDDSLPEGARVAIEANSRVDAPEGTVIGYAFQSRQFESGNRYINPLIVSPGHRVSAETAVDLVERLCAGYKLPEPTRLADAYADEVKSKVDS